MSYAPKNPKFTLMTASSGVKLKAVGAGSTTLSWYEEGTWTPVPTYAGGAAANVAITIASFTRTGREVKWTLDITFDVGTGTGAFTIAGLPYASANQAPAAIGYLDKVTLAATMSMYATCLSTVINFYTKLTGATTAMAAASATQFATTSMRLMLGGTYYI